MELRDLVLDSPERARFFCTVRAAISLARDGDAPRLRALRLIFSYCRARFVPFWMPRGGILNPSFEVSPATATRAPRETAPQGGARAALREFGHLGGSGSYLWWAALNNRGVMTTGAWSAEEP